MSKYLISDLIFQFFRSYMKKSSKSSLKKRSLDISLQHKNEASCKFSKKNFCTWPKKRAGAESVNCFDKLRTISREVNEKFRLVAKDKNKASSFSLSGLRCIASAMRSPFIRL